MLKIIVVIILYLLIGSIVSLLTYLYTEDDEVILVSIIGWPLVSIAIGFYALCESIENLGDYINEHVLNNKEDDE